MVENTPTYDEFYQTGNELLNLSWEMISNLLIRLDESEYFGIDVEEVSEDYWILARRKLTTSLAIMQQGIEFLLKGRICEISPYLLISDSPTKWPSPYESVPVEFSRFRTIDSQDLIRVHDTFSSSNLNPEFVKKFNELRELRNLIMHSISTSLNLQAEEIINSLLYMHKSLFPDESWAVVRGKSLEKSPDIEIGSGSYLANDLNHEFSIIIDLMSPAKVKKYFKIDKKMRPYFCPECYSNANPDIYFDFKLARLKSKSEICTELYCPICDNVYEVAREKCKNKNGCLGNVISDVYHICLTCGDN